MAILSPGTPAPFFEGKLAAGQRLSSNDLKGRRFALYFYPKDDTPGCTAQACSIRDNFDLLEGSGLEVIGVSADSEASHQKFTEKYQLPFRLIADDDHAISEAYGVWGEKNNYGKKYMGISRTTFIINKDGVIEHVLRKIDTAGAAAQMLALIQT